MKAVNVLITSAGRRTSLLKAFQSAVATTGGRVIAGDADALAPTLYLADQAVRLPRVDREPRAYVESLLGLVEEFRVSAIVPTIDTELAVLAAHVDEFQAVGAFPVIASPQLVGVAGDKWLTYEAYRALGIRVADSWLSPEDVPENQCDLFVKPRSGSASQHTYAVARGEDLNRVLGRVPSPIIQERLVGYEITVDAFLDFDGRPIHYVPRRRIKTLGGESIQGETLDDDAELRDWILAVLEATSSLGGVGPVTLQGFRTETGLVFSEINPRFGGGFPLAYEAGGRYPDWIVDHLHGEPVRSRLGEYERGLFMTRHNVEIFSRQPKW